MFTILKKIWVTSHLKQLHINISFVGYCCGRKCGKEESNVPYQVRGIFLYYTFRRGPQKNLHLKLKFSQKPNPQAEKISPTVFFSILAFLHMLEFSFYNKNLHFHRGKGVEQHQPPPPIAEISAKNVSFYWYPEIPEITYIVRTPFSKKQVIVLFSMCK